MYEIYDFLRHFKQGKLCRLLQNQLFCNPHTGLKLTLHNEHKEVRESLYDALMRGDESIAVARMKMRIQDIEDRIFESKASSHSIDIVVWGVCDEYLQL